MDQNGRIWENNIPQIANKASGIPQNDKSGRVNFKIWLTNRRLRIALEIAILLFRRDLPTLSLKDI